MQIAYICTPQIPSPWTDTDYVMRRVVNPACHAVAMVCLLLVAIVHFVLPQLRDLIGNMVTTLAGCMIVARAANVVRIFVEYNGPISYLIAGMFKYIYSAIVYDGKIKFIANRYLGSIQFYLLRFFNW